MPARASLYNSACPELTSGCKLLSGVLTNTKSTSSTNSFQLNKSFIESALLLEVLLWNNKINMKPKTNSPVKIITAANGIHTHAMFVNNVLYSKDVEFAYGEYSSVSETDHKLILPLRIKRYSR